MGDVTLQTIESRMRNAIGQTVAGLDQSLNALSAIASVISTIASTRSGALTSVAPHENSTSATILAFARRPILNQPKYETRRSRDKIEEFCRAFYAGSAAELAGYLARHELAFPLHVDEHGEMATRWGVHALPTSFVIDGNGRIRHVTAGLTTGVGLRLRLWLARG